ncbi:MAG: CDP-alcohol phosphatidyltransferase family protein [Pseudomonadota bacterium]
MIRHIPNMLSGLRLLAAPFAAWLILHDRDTAALIIFALAGASDGLDGYVARRWGFMSRFGAWLDPVADKMLMLFSLTALYMVGATPMWLLALVVVRDAAIAAGWLLINQLGLPQRSEPLLIGKISTVVQVLYILTMLLLLALEIKAPGISDAAAWITGLVTVCSAAAYAGAFLRGAVTEKKSP